MGDISRDSDTVELTAPPEFSYGERVVTRYTIRNDGTYCGKDIGEVLAKKGDVGFVTSIGNFLQQYYIYAVEFIETGNRVGMRGRELVSIDKLPEHVMEALGEEKIARLKNLRPGVEAADEENLSVEGARDHVRAA
ncbi:MULTISPECIES: nitrogen fixation protein NifZ [Uliginosibacterium]|jgi:nitrogen fixation protein NifZ|uniref:Nitrogen fixation protein NifZ n=1 Tax=Uliginosibacterium aquaticum TaxID=2731212 RepID=A0ABX2IE96_9RHOO|nr:MULTISPECIES: nitrogen fixation protein NifZ [Uliginosibacterium]MDO6385322.1 nitrogen fixation protein NifZ [Uliginosibacterium sp. 31-12]NSL54858.1 nitrogen fixation protein NifZ [Uliginosibacterium aquaticum]PLK47796.1 nitrogen fixation protein NifZ [Uliginosibacterium sp. TH139]